MLFMISNCGIGLRIQPPLECRVQPLDAGDHFNLENGWFLNQHIPMKISLLLCCTFLASVVCCVRADPPQPIDDLHKTLNMAAEGNKMAFILLGRPTCGNCNATKAMIREGKIPVSDADYVMADLNVDDQRTEAGFMRKFGKEKFGDTLPFVVVTNSQGKVLASSGGYKNAQQWTALLTEAKSKASANSATSTSGTSDWPFKSPAH